MPLPTLSPEQRAAALEKAAEIRKARAELKEQLKAGKTTQKVSVAPATTPPAKDAKAVKELPAQG